MRLFFIFCVLFLPGSFLHAQNEVQVVVLHDTLGVTIDSTEKSNYHLFPYWHTEEFDHAQVMMHADSALFIVGTMKDGSVKTLPCTRTEFLQNHYLVSYYCGQVAPAESLWPVLFEIVIRSGIEAASHDCKSSERK